MNTLLRWLFLTLFLSTHLAYAATPPPCDGKLALVFPAKADQLRDFLAWLPGHLPKNMEDPGKTAGSIYIADVDNDGKDEFIAIQQEGSGGYLSLFVFHRQGKSFAAISELPKPANETMDGPWYSHEFYNRITQSGELFGTLCGKTYFLFSGSDDGEREAYLWQGGETTRACGPDWLKFQRKDFQALYDAKLYSLAMNNLRGFLRACTLVIPPAEKIHILSDLSVTAFHMNDKKTCTAFTEEAKRLPDFASSPEKQAVLHNENLCRNVKDAPADFRWLLTAQGEWNKVVGGNPKFDSLLTATVPDFDYKSASFDKRAQTWFKEGVMPWRGANDLSTSSLRETVRDNLSPPGFSLDTVKNRYVTVSGCRPHSCEDKALLWVDVEKKKSVFATNDYKPPGTDKFCFAIGSRTLDEKSLPKEFWERFHYLKVNTTADQPCVLFFNGKGRTVSVHEIKIPGGK
ncbi:MAG: hypothetical protein ACXWQO_18565 [Bdellovibrionota bacterium]